MKRRRPQLSVQLFPFLSVLLCTLGALVLLLLVLDQKARQKNAEEAARRDFERRRQTQHKAAEIQARLQSFLETQKRLHSQAQIMRSRQRDQEELLKQRMAEFGSAEKEVVASRGRLNALDLEAKGLEAKRQGAAVQRQAAETSRGSLERQVATMENAVARLQQSLENRAPVYSLVPYKGKQGTRRQPIYVECVGQQVIFRPTALTMALTELEEGDRFNQAVLREAARLGSSAEDHPYVLLLVRPSGIGGYYAAVRAMRNSPIDLGYEFVNEDWKLDYEPAPQTDQGRETASARPGTGLPGAGAGTANPQMSNPSKNAAAGAYDPRFLAQKMASQRPASGPQQNVSAEKQTEDGSPGTPRPLNLGEKAVRDLSPWSSPRQTWNEEKGRRSPDDQNTRSRDQDGEKEPQPGDQAAGRGQKGEAGGSRLPLPRGVSVPRDWEIVIECTANDVVIKGLNQRIDQANLTRLDNPFQTALVKLIQERQMRVPGLKPRLRFLIHKDGLRTYYLAAGMIEELRLPASFEILKEPARLPTR